MKSDETQIKKAVEQLGKQIKLDTNLGTNQNIDKLASDFMEKGHMPKDIMNLSDQQMEGLYAQAYNFYQTGRYKDAIQIFRLLIMLNANDVKYSMGLAACLHMMKDYKNAAQTYTLCSILDPQSPVPFYHMSDCFLGMKDSYSAIVALDMAIKRAGDKKEFQMLKDRAVLTMENLKQEIKEKTKT